MKQNLDCIKVGLFYLRIRMIQLPVIERIVKFILFVQRFLASYWYFHPDFMICEFSPEMKNVNHLTLFISA